MNNRGRCMVSPAARFRYHRAMNSGRENTVKHPRTATGATPLARRLSLPLLLLYGLGTILGAGVYVLIAKIAGLAGPFAPWAFLIAAAVAIVTGLSYAELAARLPRSAGAALYVFSAFGSRRLSLVVAGLVMLTGIVSAATLSNSFVGYFRLFFEAPAAAVMTALVLAIVAIAAWGIAESVRAAATVTVIEIAGLLMVLWAAREASVPPAAWVPPLEAGIWQGIFLAGVIAFYAFIGFEDMANVAEEVKRPERDLPRAILLSLLIVTAIYTAVAYVAITAIPISELAQSNAPMALVYARTTGESPLVIGVISLFAVVNGALVQVIMASRLLYGVGREAWLPARPSAALAYVHPRTRTPLVATALVGVAVLAFALTVSLTNLAKATSFIMLIVFTIVHAALFRLKRQTPLPAGAWRVPLAVPVLGFLMTGSLMLYQLIAWLR